MGLFVYFQINYYNYYNCLIIKNNKTKVNQVSFNDLKNWYDIIDNYSYNVC